MQLLVAGAGFSKPAGVPLLSELTELLVSAMDQSADLPQPLKESADRISRFCREMLGCEHDKVGDRLLKLGLEELCTAVDWAIDRGDVLEEGLEPKAVAESLKELLVWTIRECEKNPSKVDQYARFLRELDQRTQGHWAIVSLNWDTVVERAATDAGIPLCLGPTVFRQAEDESIRRFEPTDKRLLIKLHGSVNWSVCRQCRGLFAFARAPGSCPNCAPYRFLPLSPIVVVPTLLKRVHNPSLDLLWDEALSLLRRASKLTIVGYSLPTADYEVRHLLARATRDKGDETSVVLCDRDREAGTAERYRSLLGLKEENFCYEGVERLLGLEGKVGNVSV